ncbi:ABC transporter substrate-binding protein [Magnetospira sp. QH-2]|uniref:substrate-binding periplasmic protein n=1 Tax=Magnetospira sp. (strain QH-2) TaxID=1288970 RepID=UPI0003E81377|nr:transporter substrate-binding domain-containing protein [Magnetospira sp. QH-2]CCQ75547.1 Putative ABC-type amino acid transport/signal transduction systems, periplasmic component/domain [Magnetospira sp. QH-2]
MVSIVHRPFFIIAVLSLLMGFPGIALAQDKEVAKVCYLNWGKQGGKHLPQQGFIPDLLATVLRKAGYEPIIDIIPWERCLEMVKRKTYDFVGSYWIGGEMDPWYDYFLPTTVDRINFIGTKGANLKSGRLEDLYGKRIGFLKGAGGLKSFRDQIDHFEAFEVSNDIAMIRMLKNGRIDAILSNSPHIIGLAETDYPELVDQLVVLQPPVQTNIASPAIAVDNPRRVEMKKRYNKAYQALVAEGIYQRLMEKHQIRVEHTMTADDLKVFEAAQR